MRSSFFGIEIARRALNAQQVALDLTGHNIANANTPGYSRQVSNFTATTPVSFGGLGQIGTGVEVKQIQRIRDAFVDAQIRKERQSQGRWQSRWEALQQTQLIFTEPSDAGIRASFDAFWVSLAELAKHPEDPAVRSVVREQASVLTDTIRHTHWQLVTQQKDTNQQIEIKVGEVNSLAQRIADLNQQIIKARNLDLEPNDLLDKRDLLLNELAGLINITTNETGNGAITVGVGGINLVEGNQVRAIIATRDPGNSDLLKLTWAGLGEQAVSLSNGYLKGLFEIRDELIPSLLDGLNDLVTTFTQAFNTIHAGGFDLNGNPVAGTAWADFFVGSPENPSLITAGNITVNPAILDDSTNGLDRIAAALTPAPGDGDNALLLSELGARPLAFASVTGSVNDFYGALIAEVGVAAQKATQMHVNQGDLVAHLQNWQEGISGVSLDEEMGNMIRFQHAYNAAARALTAVDEVLDVIINRMGLVGR